MQVNPSGLPPPRYVYGPVPSHRLGRSLGVDIVSHKRCTYDCVYCQLGRTTHLTAERSDDAPVSAVLDELHGVLASGPRPDFVSIAGSGEPTLHAGIGELLRGLRRLTDVPRAVLTNGSLLWMPEVQDALLDADVVLPSLDAGSEPVFRAVNRPHASVSFERMTAGTAEFTRRFRGEVWLEVMLVAGMNDDRASVSDIASLVRRIAPARVQLTTVQRPPADPSVRRVREEDLRTLARMFDGRVDIVTEHAPGGSRESARPLMQEPDDIRRRILALVARRPCTAADIARAVEMNVLHALKRLDELRAAGDVRVVVSDGHPYYTAADTVPSSGRVHQ